MHEALNPLFLKTICTLVLLPAALVLTLQRKKNGSSAWLPSDAVNPQKRACEIWFFKYGVFWITVFGIIVGCELYKSFDKAHYLAVCGGLASPLLLQPILFPSVSRESDVPLMRRYSFKANLWIAIFSFIGNYWYTHYFYSVLKARYTMPSWDFNGVPVAMFFATHFYFCFYHALSNAIIRKIATTYEQTRMRFVFTSSVVVLLSYATAYAETLTISSFPCYAFEDRGMVYSIGSAFYGIYFIVSFPMFYRLDEANRRRHSWADAAIESLATGMMVLLLLDFVRVFLGKDLELRLQRPCKIDASLTCAPFDGQFC